MGSIKGPEAQLRLLPGLILLLRLVGSRVPPPPRPFNHTVASSSYAQRVRAWGASPACISAFASDGTKIRQWQTLGHVTLRNPFPAFVLARLRYELDVLRFAKRQNGRFSPHGLNSAKISASYLTRPSIARSIQLYMREFTANASTFPFELSLIDPDHINGQIDASTPSFWRCVKIGVGSILGLDPDRAARRGTVTKREFKFYGEASDDIPPEKIAKHDETVSHETATIRRRFWRDPHKDRFPTQVAVGLLLHNPSPGNRDATIMLSSAGLMALHNTQHGGKAAEQHKSSLDLVSARPPLTGLSYDSYYLAQVTDALQEDDQGDGQRFLEDGDAHYDETYVMGSEAAVMHMAQAEGDIVLFKGSQLWHTRMSPTANTDLLYIKLNFRNLDPFQNDPVHGDADIREGSYEFYRLDEYAPFGVDECFRVVRGNNFVLQCDQTALEELDAEYGSTSTLASVVSWRAAGTDNTTSCSVRELGLPTSQEVKVDCVDAAEVTTETCYAITNIASAPQQHVHHVEKEAALPTGWRAAGHGLQQLLGILAGDGVVARVSC